MKARDIIPGWPKGRSTSGPLRRLPHLWLVGLQPFDDIQRAESEEYEELQYRRHQAAMVDAFRQYQTFVFPMARAATLADAFFEGISELWRATSP